MIGTTSCNPQIRNTEPLTREEEYDLILRAKSGDQAAQTRLIRKNKGLIMKAVSRFSSQVDWRVLKTAGDTAVLTAINKFDLSTGNRFSTYLVPTLQSEVRDCFCRETGITRNTLKNLGKISKASAALRQELGREATLEEIIDRSELSQRQILNAWRNKAHAQPHSLNQRFNEDCAEWLDSQIDETADPWGLSEEVEVFDTLEQLESSGYLQGRQVTMLVAKHQGYNNPEIGEQFGVSGERVRQLIRDAKKTVVAFKEGTLKLRPKPIETKIPASTHHDIEPIGEGDQLTLDMPAPEESRKPVVERVDATRLGGRIGRAIKKFFNPTREGFDYQLGELTNVAKPILALGRRSNHGPVDVSWHQQAPENQRCHRLGRIEDVWGGYLGIGQEILSIFLLPLAFVYLAVRGFQENRIAKTRRSVMPLIATDVFKFFGMEYRKEHPRPPNHCPDTDEDSS